MVFGLFAWDEGKNRWLTQVGRPSFEEVVNVIRSSETVDVRNHPSRPGQKLIVALVNGYPHAVPFEQRGDVTWLITVYPARKFKNEKEKIRP